MQTDLHDIDTDSTGIPGDAKALAKGLEQAEASHKLKDFYTVGLWNYCYGKYDDGAYTVTNCTEREAKFWFNPAKVWGLDDKVEDLFPHSLQKGLDAYKKVSGWLFVAYIIATVATAVQLVVGISAIFSRWGSFATTICAGVSDFYFYFLFFLPFARSIFPI